MKKRNYWMRKKSYWQTLAYMVGCVRGALRGPLPTPGADATLKLKRDPNWLTISQLVTDLLKG